MIYQTRPSYSGTGIPTCEAPTGPELHPRPTALCGLHTRCLHVDGFLYLVGGRDQWTQLPVSETCTGRAAYIHNL
jgi:hypothetical protein